MDDDNRSMDVIVTETQLSQAIGRNGQNVRLASQLTGWTLNVLSEQQAEERESEEQERLLELFTKKLAVSEERAIQLIEAGFTSIEEIAYVPSQELLEIEGVDEKVLTELREKAKDILLTQAITKEERLGEHEPAEDLLSLEGLDKHEAYLLASRGIITREDLAELAVEDLMDIENMTQEKAGKLIMAARQHWFEE